MIATMRVGAADTGEVVIDIDGRQMRCTWMEAMEIGAQLIAWAGWASAEVDADAGLVQNRGRSAFVKFVLGNAKVESVKWVTETQLCNAIEAMKDWEARAYMEARK